MPEKIPSTASRGACPSCGLERVGENLEVFKRAGGGFGYRCYACTKRRSNEIIKERYHADPEFRRARYEYEMNRRKADPDAYREYQRQYRARKKAEKANA